MSGLYIVFRVAESEYALAAAQVLQLESFGGATAVPGTLPHVTGIVQVRGRIVPVIDLRLLFGEPGVSAGADTRIIVVELRQRTVALRVDNSREVLNLTAEQIQPPPAVVSERSRGFVSAVARVGNRLLMILNLEKVIGEEELHDDPDHILEDGSAGRRALPG
ncbi:MAG TPA: chemotaxis protein CheW [Polyangiaceae bacterium]|nr:chemotaxis protein CheW [Polyangiaceae bacterium]